MNDSVRGLEGMKVVSESAVVEKHEQRCIETTMC